MGISGGIGAMIGVILGEHAYAFYWLLAFVLIDYVTGLAAACINRVASSSVGFRGLIKKVIIVCVCLLCHGLDQVSHMPFIGLGLVFAFMANEMVSILENISKAGYGSVIPKAVRQIIEAAEDQQINLIKEKLGCGSDKKTEKDK